MDPQIHGALAGGALGGAVVAAGIVAEHRLQAARDRRSAIEAAVLEISQMMGFVAAGFVDRNVDREPGSPWVDVKDRAFGCATQVRLLARGRRWRKTRREADRFLAGLGAALSRVVFENRMLPIEVAASLQAKELVNAVFGETTPLTKEWQRWLDRWDQP